MSDDLLILSQHRQALLLAEIDAWLHNIGKLSKEFLLYQQKDPLYKNYNYQGIVGFLTDWWSINQAGLSTQLKDAFKDDVAKSNDPLTASLLDAKS